MLPLPVLGAAGVFIVAAVSVFVFLSRGSRPRTQARTRLEGEAAEQAAPRPVRAVDTFPPRYRVIPWVVGIIIIAVGVLGSLSALFSIVVGVIVILLGLQLEQSIAERRVMRIETQLAETIDLTVSSLNSGASIVNSLDYASGEIRAPLRDYFREALDRIRLGDQPQVVFRSLADRIPLDNFRLFITAITVNWESGGALGPTLATVGQAIRDRIEVSRRIRSMTAASRIAIIVVLILTYFIAFAMYQADPDRAERFATSEPGTVLIAIAVLLQAIGIAWSNAISKPRF
jgi:tight adherence protein B